MSMGTDDTLAALNAFYPEPEGEIRFNLIDEPGTAQASPEL